MKFRVNNSAVVWVVLFLIGASIITIQYTTLPRLKTFVLSASLNDHTQVIVQNAMKLFFAHWSTVLTPLDFLIIGFLAVLLFALALSELTSNKLSLFLSRLDGNPRQLMLFLLFTAVVTTRYYLNPGQVFLGDAETYTVRSWMVSEHLKNMQFPVWSNYWYGGFPLLQFYAPLLFVVIAVFNLIFQDIHLATKLVLWTSHVGSVFVMFYFLREATRKDLSALLGAVAYGLVFHRIYIVLYQGDLHLSLVFLLYPLILLIVEKYLNGRSSSRNAFLSFTFASSALILTHHAYAFFGLVFVAVYLLVRVMISQNTRAAKFKILAFFAFTSLCAFLISAFSLLPFILELHEVRGMPKIPFHLLLPAIPSLEGLCAIFGTMLRWTAVGHTGNVTYVGVSLILFSLLSMFYVAQKRMAVGLALLTCTVVSFSTLKDHTMYNVKNLNFVVFFLTALTAYTPQALQSLFGGTAVFETLKNRWGKSFETKTVLILLAMILVDLGPTTFQNVYREDLDFKGAMYSKILNIDRNYKVIERPSTRYDPAKGFKENFDRTKLGIPSAYAAIQTPLGWFHEGSPKSISYNAEMVKKLHLDLNEGYISELALKGLYLMGVKFLLFRDRSRYYEPPLKPTSHYSIDGSVLEFKDVRPLLVSPRLLHISDLADYKVDNIIETGNYFDLHMYAYETPHFEEIVKPLIEKMKINLARGTADYLLIGGPFLSATGDGTKDIDIRIKEFVVAIDTVTLRYTSNRNGFGELPYSHFPYLDVRADGKRIPFYRSAMHYVIVPLASGEHVITIGGRASPLSKWTFFFSLAFTPVVLFVIPRILSRFDRNR